MIFIYFLLKRFGHSALLGALHGCERPRTPRPPASRARWSCSSACASARRSTPPRARWPGRQGGGTSGIGAHFPGARTTTRRGLRFWLLLPLSQIVSRCLGLFRVRARRSCAAGVRWHPQVLATIRISIASTEIAPALPQRSLARRSRRLRMQLNLVHLHHIHILYQF